MCGVGVNFSNPGNVRPFSRVLVLGNGVCGDITAKALSEVGLSCTYAQVSQLPSSIYGNSTNEQSLDNLHVSDRSGTKWTTVTLDNMPPVKREGIFFKIEHDHFAGDLFSCVVIAFGASVAVNPEKMPAGMTLFEQAEPVGPPQRLGFLLGDGKGSDRDVGISAVATALKNQEQGGASYVFFQNMPVSVPGGEPLYDQAKKAGVCFIRYEKDREPVVDQIPGDKNAVTFHLHVVDSVAGGDPMDIQCDRVYAAGFLDASSINTAMRGIVNYDVDQNGFLLSESIHGGLGQSFTRGVFAVGGCTGTLGLAQTVSQAYTVAVKARAWTLRASRLTSVDTISINDECVRCLTCFRICPHSAISVNYGPSRSTITSLSASCEQCGLCISECPREALDLIGFPQKGIESFLADIRQHDADKLFVVYGCERSTSDSIAKIHLPSDVLFLAVPCAGRISESMLWATLSAGASGVLVVGCHPGNCASRNGTQWAGNRVKQVLSKLHVSGIATPLVSYAAVSARQPARLEILIREFKRSLDEYAFTRLIQNENRQ